MLYWRGRSYFTYGDDEDGDWNRFAWSETRHVGSSWKALEERQSMVQFSLALATTQPHTASPNADISEFTL
jgi:hypothetical protein